MPDLYKVTKKLAESELKAEGYRFDRLKEGLFKEISTDRSIVFHVTGMWSHVELHVGVRFRSVSEKGFHASRLARWPIERSELFRSPIVGVFYEKIGDFCAAVEDIGVYCPIDSHVASSHDIMDILRLYTAKFSELESIRDTLDYVMGRSLFDPYGAYMIPIMAKICADDKIWKWSTEHFLRIMHLEEESQYRLFVDSLNK